MSITDKLAQINTVKQDIKTALTNKGVDVTNTPFTEYASKISEISSGGESGSIIGNFTVTSNGLYEPGIYEYIFSTENGNFQDKKIILVVANRASSNVLYLFYRSNINESFNTYVGYRGIDNEGIIDDGFSFTFLFSSSVIENNSISFYGNIDNDKYNIFGFIAI